jgi:LPS export ABC transporter protein LptC
MLNNLSAPGSSSIFTEHGAPDYYMEDFTTINMAEDGTPANKLQALYVAHYPDYDSTELQRPLIEFYRSGNSSVYVSANKGWATRDNAAILLDGNVTMLEQDPDGGVRLQILADTARILPDRGYAETDGHAEIVSGRTIIRGTGMRAHLHDGRLELLNNVHTTIKPR